VPGRPGYTTRRTEDSSHIVQGLDAEDPDDGPGRLCRVMPSCCLVGPTNDERPGRWARVEPLTRPFGVGDTGIERVTSSV
jgi:hypothetical protein